MGNERLTTEEIQIIRTTVNKTESKIISNYPMNPYEEDFHFDKDTLNDNVLHEITPDKVNATALQGNRLKKLKDIEKTIGMQNEYIQTQNNDNIQFSHDINEIKRSFIYNPAIWGDSNIFSTDEPARILYFFHFLLMRPVIYNFDDNFIIYLNGIPNIICKESIQQWIPMVLTMEKNEQLYVPCSISEKEALLRLLISDYSLFKSPIHSIDFPIFYGSIIDSIHSNIIDDLIDNIKTSIYAREHGDPVKIANKISDKWSKYIGTFYGQPNANSSWIKAQQTQIYRKNSESMALCNRKEIYNNIRDVLERVCGDSISSLNQFSVLLAKIFAGKELLKILKNDNKNSTIIVSKNPWFIRNLLIHIITGMKIATPLSLGTGICIPDYSSCNITEYSTRVLSNPQNLSRLIWEKLFGNIVNIDTSIGSDISPSIKDIISGKAIKVDDDIVGKLTYRTNAHFIFLRESINEPFYKNIEDIADCIDLSSVPLDKYEYKNELRFHEIFFLVYGLVRHGIGLLIEDKNTISMPTQEEGFKEFVTKYLKNDKNESILGKKLYNHYTDFQRATVRSSYNFNNFRDKIKSLFPDAEYKKGHTARSFIGLKFDEIAFSRDIAALQNKVSIQTNAKEEFISYLEEIISSFHQHINSKVGSILSGVS